MKTSVHLELADQWQAALDKLDPQKDHIVLVEICMMMGTTLMNAIMHKRGINEEVYDQNHTNRPEIESAMKAKITPDVRTMMDDLFYLEEMRKLHCRGVYPDKDERDLPTWDPAVSDKCLAKIKKIKAFQVEVFKE